MTIKSLKLGEALFEEGHIDLNQLEEALELQKRDKRWLGKILLEKGWIDELTLAKTLAEMFQLPFVKLADFKVDPAVFRLIPYELLQDYKVFPLAVEKKQLTLAVNNPLDVDAMQDIQIKSGCSVNPVMASLSDIEDHLQEHVDTIRSVQATKTNGAKPAADSQVIQLVDALIRRAIKERVSDIHFEPLKDRLRIRFRIDGELHERPSVEKALERNIISRIKIVSGMDVTENRKPQDGRMSFVNGHMEYDLRISTLPNTNGENLVLRILNKQFVYHSLDSLGVDRHESSLMSELLKRPHGLILVTGPTGAGKTTTLYAMLNMLNTMNRSIVSVEDPVEYELEGINQTAINPFIGYTFANSIRHILRHDPNVIMVGEIRDVETAEMAIRAALTGHLVLSTMHTNTAAGAITRLLEMNIESFLISSAVSGVIAQRLVRRLCPKCQKEFSPDQAMIKNIQKVVPMADTQKLAQAAGCDECSATGYKGRVGVFEILKIDDDIRGLILNSANEQAITEKAISKGMKTLQMAGMQKVIDKITTVEEMSKIISA